MRWPSRWTTARRRRRRPPRSCSHRLVLAADFAKWVEEGRHPDRPGSGRQPDSPLRQKLSDPEEPARLQQAARPAPRPARHLRGSERRRRVPDHQGTQRRLAPGRRGRRRARPRASRFGDAGAPAQAAIARPSRARASRSTTAAPGRDRRHGSDRLRSDGQVPRRGAGSTSSRKSITRLAREAEPSSRGLQPAAKGSSGSARPNVNGCGSSSRSLTGKRGGAKREPPAGRAPDGRGPRRR